MQKTNPIYRNWGSSINSFYYLHLFSIFVCTRLKLFLFLEPFADCDPSGYFCHPMLNSLHIWQLFLFILVFSSIRQVFFLTVQPNFSCGKLKFASRRLCPFVCDWSTVGSLQWSVLSFNCRLLVHGHFFTWDILYRSSWMKSCATKTSGKLITHLSYLRFILTNLRNVLAMAS